MGFRVCRVEDVGHRVYQPGLYRIDRDHPEDSDVVLLQGRHVVKDVHVDVVEREGDG